MFVSPLPFSDGVTMERAWLEAIALADDAADLHIRSLVVVEAAVAAAHAAAFMPHATNLMIRLPAARADRDGSGARGLAGGPLEGLLRAVRIVEIESGPGLERAIDEVRALNPRLLVSVYLRYGAGFWEALERAVGHEAVAMVQVAAGAEKSYRLIPRVDTFLKARLNRARVQLVSAGGDTHAQAPAATGDESVLLGSNGGALTDNARLALLPRLGDPPPRAAPAPLRPGVPPP